MWSKENIKLGIVILNYQNYSDTIECVESIEKSVFGISYKIYIIDNASMNDSYDILSDLYHGHSNIELIQNPENYGYSKGNNIGIRQALSNECNLVLISNSDIIFLNDSINKIVDLFIENTEIGIIAPKVLDTKFNESFVHHYRYTELWEKYFVRTILKKLNVFNMVTKFYGHNIDRESLHDIVVPSGCCYCFNLEISKYIYPLDENTFLYSEECILAQKLKNNKMRIVCYPSAKVIHKEKQEIKTKAFSYLENFASEIYYCKKYLNYTSLYYPLFLYRIIGYLLRAVFFKDYQSEIKKLKRVTKNIISKK